MTLDFIWHFFCFFPSTFGFKIQGLRLQKKTTQRFAVHPSYCFPVEKFLKHVGKHLKSCLDAIQGSDYFRDGQTDRRRPHAPALYTDHSLSHPSQVPSLWAPTTKPSIWSLLPCCQLTKPILSSMRTGWKEFEIPFPFSSVCLPSNNCHFVPQTKQQNAWERGENGLVRRGRSTSAWESMKIFW